MVIDLFTERIFQVFIGFLCLFRMVHGFTCSGLTETQYVNSCKASRIGHVEQQYISTGNVTVPVCSLQVEFLLFNWVLLLPFIFRRPNSLCGMESTYTQSMKYYKLCSLLLHLLVHSSLGYKDAVKSVYERKLVEARTEAQQDPQYLLRGDVSIYFFNSN